MSSHKLSSTHHAILILSLCCLILRSSPINAIVNVSALPKCQPTINQTDRTASMDLLFLIDSSVGVDQIGHRRMLEFIVEVLQQIGMLQRWEEERRSIDITTQPLHQLLLALAQLTPEPRLEFDFKMFSRSGTHLFPTITGNGSLAEQIMVGSVFKFYIDRKNFVEKYAY